VLISILRRRIFWVCTTLLLLTIAACIYVYRAAYAFCAGGELVAGWLCNSGDTQQFNVDFYTTPDSSQTNGAGSTVVSTTTNISLPKPWNGKERVNVLVMGIDQRAGETDPGYRTDTMIVLTIDPVTLEAGILSVPRDLWVPIPGYDNGRINTANFLGDSYKYPGGGPELARKTVEMVLGIPIQYYARVNFTVFEEFIDRIGGITVDVPEDIYDPEYPTNDYRTEVFSITQGIHNMDGATALKFARTRHSLVNGDFDRARDQQLVLLAVKDKLTSPQALISLLSNAPDLLAKLNASISTNLSFDQIQQLAALAQKVDRKHIKSAVLDQTYTEFAATLTDPPQWVQVPIRARIADLRDTFFTTVPNGAVITDSTSTASDPTPTPSWQAENASVILLNGTANAELAQQVGDRLIAEGFKIVRTGETTDGRSDYNHTIVTDYGGKTQTLAALIDVLGVHSTAEQKHLLDPHAEADVVIILGSDAKLP
jgi:polyisoprenyl-teichoic acid--peptidoglycan teichoic acid transferase